MWFVSPVNSQGERASKLTTVLTVRNRTFFRKPLAPGNSRRMWLNGHLQLMAV